MGVDPAEEDQLEAPALFPEGLAGLEQRGLSLARFKDADIEKDGIRRVDGGAAGRRRAVIGPEGQDRAVHGGPSGLAAHGGGIAAGGIRNEKDRVVGLEVAEPVREAADAPRPGGLRALVGNRVVEEDAASSRKAAEPAPAKGPLAQGEDLRGEKAVLVRRRSDCPAGSGLDIGTAPGGPAHRAAVDGVEGPQRLQERGRDPVQPGKMSLPARLGGIEIEDRHAGRVRSA